MSKRKRPKRAKLHVAVREPTRRAAAAKKTLKPKTLPEDLPRSGPAPRALRPKRASLVGKLKATPPELRPKRQIILQDKADPFKGARLIHKEKAVPSRRPRDIAQARKPWKRESDDHVVKFSDPSMLDCAKYLRKKAQEEDRRNSIIKSGKGGRNTTPHRGPKKAPEPNPCIKLRRR